MDRWTGWCDLVWDEETQPETLLRPSQSFRIVQDGEFVGDEVPPSLQEVVLGDCIPSHILSGEEIIATPVNFFRREWFQATPLTHHYRRMYSKTFGYLRTHQTRIRAQDPLRAEAWLTCAAWAMQWEGERVKAIVKRRFTRQV
ncbi:hypothetical protein V1522DRAFT_395784 [Lipomyces starkeyi]